MPRVEQDNAKLAGFDGGMVGAFPYDQRIHTSDGGFTQRIARGSSSGANGPTSRAPAGRCPNGHQRTPFCPRDGIRASDQKPGVDIGIPHDADSNRLKSSETLTRIQSKSTGEQDVVAQCRVKIEG